MRLTNQQIDALTNQICKEHNDKIDKQLDNRLKLPAVVKKAKKTFQIYSKLDEATKRVLNPFGDKTLKDFIRAYAQEVPIEGVKLVKIDVKNEIILASIDCNSIEEIKKKLNNLNHRR